MHSNQFVSHTHKVSLTCPPKPRHMHKHTHTVTTNNPKHLIQRTVAKVVPSITRKHNRAL